MSEYNHNRYLAQMLDIIHPVSTGPEFTVLLLLIGIQLLYIFIVYLIPEDDIELLRTVPLLLSMSFLICWIDIWYSFNPFWDSNFQRRCTIPIIPEIGFNLSFGLDGLSLCFIMLTVFIMPVCLFALNPAQGNYKRFILCIFVTEFFLLLSFLTTNIIFFYAFFESVLIPMYLIIGLWGSRDRKIYAAMYFAAYTVIGGFFLLFGAYYLFQKNGSFEYNMLIYPAISLKDQSLIWWCFFIPFAIKIPMIPFHIWLPEAHVEAPTIGSVILASLLLKLGGYGFLRFTITMFDYAIEQWFWFIATIAVFGVIAGSLAAMRQNDLKRIIAYSSVAHMNLVVLGLFSHTHQGIDGAIYLMIAHGIVSGALFICIGVLYDRYHTRSLKHYSGLAQVMPLFCGYFFLFTLANMAFPGTSNFVGEILIFVGLFEYHNMIMILGSTGVVLSAVYSIWLFNRVSFGTLQSDTENIPRYADLNRPEIYILVVLAAAMFALGLYSTFVTYITFWPIKKILFATVYKTMF